MAQIINGKETSQKLIDSIKLDVQKFEAQQNVRPCLTVILVGEDPASKVYVKNKIKRASEVGIDSREHILTEESSQAELLTLIDQLNNDNSVHGILVQLPLPAHIDEDAIIAAIEPKKDVDGFHPMNVGALVAGNAKLKPCTPYGCMLLLQTVHEDLSGKVAVVIGRSNIVGKPMSSLLLQANCTVITVHSRTKNIEALCSQADIVIAAVGRPQIVKANWLKKGATVIDVGINVLSNDGKRKLVGDVDFDDVEPKVDAITPVPGGVGPMTIACLMKNTLTAAQMQIES